MSGVEPNWPDGRRFAFSIFDDPDSQTLEASQAVYGFLKDHGILTTKGVWPLAPSREASDQGETCGNEQFTRHCLELQDQGFEIGFHNATSHSSTRDETELGLRRFRELFGEQPITMSNHYFNNEGIYFGADRLTGIRKTVLNLLPRKGKTFHGHQPESEYFWGDLCQGQVQYVRCFTFPEINTLKACPYMPYHDPAKPYVRGWYSSSEGSNHDRFLELLSEENQDRLESEGGACIAYTHFGHGFYDGALGDRFKELVIRLSRKGGWCVPVRTLLDHLASQGRPHTITAAERRGLEWRWLRGKAKTGSH
jgi:hypothetical protein